MRLPITTLTAATTAALAIMLFSNRADAVIWTTGDELVSHCRGYAQDPSSAAGIACASYVQGFVGGAEATDKVVAAQVSAYTERALETRIKQRIDRFGATAYAGYCLDRTLPRSEIVREVVSYIAEHPDDAGKTAHEIVYAALKKFHPCP